MRAWLFTPKLPNDKQVEGKVYIINTPDSKQLPKGEVFIEQANKPSTSAKVALYSDGENKWNELETTASGSSSLKANAPTGGIFAVLSSK